jgi:hypothetical protein
MWKAHLVLKTHEWELLRRQFNALTHEESVESVEDIFDAQFRRRFAELINQIAKSDRITNSTD